MFLKINLIEKCYKIFKKKGDIKDLTDVTTDLFLKNMFDWYLDRSNESFKNYIYI